MLSSNLTLILNFVLIFKRTQCRLHHQNAPVDRKREAFDEICNNFSPAFRFFFHERFIHSLQAWHAARMNYVTSCAVSSIVGHVLGIGDRHSHNILIHQKSGKVVHIDFGIVFEQGKVNKNIDGNSLSLDKIYLYNLVRPNCLFIIFFQSVWLFPKLCRSG